MKSPPWCTDGNLQISVSNQRFAPAWLLLADGFSSYQRHLFSLRTVHVNQGEVVVVECCWVVPLSEFVVVVVVSPGLLTPGCTTSL
jgi:hypothetical protein